MKSGLLAYRSILLESAVVPQLYKPTVECKTG